MTPAEWAYLESLPRRTLTERVRYWNIRHALEDTPTIPDMGIPLRFTVDMAAPVSYIRPYVGRAKQCIMTHANSMPCGCGPVGKFSIMYRDNCASLEALGEPAMNRETVIELIVDVLCAIRDVGGSNGGPSILRLIDEAETRYEEEVRSYVVSTRS